MHDMDLRIPGFLMLSVLFALVVIPASAETYTNDEHQFSIDYPQGWHVVEIGERIDELDHTAGFYEGADYIVQFHDDPDSWQSFFEVILIKNPTYLPLIEDERLFDELNYVIEKRCQYRLHPAYGNLCIDHSLIDSSVVHIGGKKSYQTVYSWTEQGPQTSPNISTRILIPDGFNTWIIYSESADSAYPIYRDGLYSAFYSFDSFKPMAEIAREFKSGTDGNMLFQKGDHSFHAVMPSRQVSMITPHEFADEWYYNLENDFAILFPDSWEDHWTLDENFQGRKVAEFSSKTSDGKLVFFARDDPALAQTLLSPRSEELKLQIEKIITETAAGFPGFFQVDTITSTRYKDGRVISAPLFEIDDLGKFRTYSVVYFVLENGKIFEMIYFGDEFSTIGYTDYYTMAESFYSGDVSSIPSVDRGDASDTEPYTNHELGFSFMPPRDWKRVEPITLLGTQSFPENMVLLVSYRSQDYQDSFPPMMMVAHDDDSGAFDVKSVSKTRFEKDFRDWIDEFISAPKFVSHHADTDFEYGGNFIKMISDAEIEINLPGETPYDYSMRVIQWNFEDGEAYSFFLISGPEDVNVHAAKFQESVDSVKFEPRQEPEPGGGCLIATAAYGSEMAPQVQQLREFRDNIILDTESGASFMALFNQFYYLFSPTVADWERQNPAFREAVKIMITPMLLSLSIINHAGVDSEEGVAGYGAGIILLNVGMYLVLPAFTIRMICNHVKGIRMEHTSRSDDAD